MRDSPVPSLSEAEAFLKAGHRLRGRVTGQVISCQITLSLQPAR